MSPEFEKFLMEKINLIFKVVKWFLIIAFLSSFITSLINVFGVY